MRLRWGIALGLWLACACALAGVPERPRFRIAGPAQGLPSTGIRALARDRDGYVWIGTADGLARYDGVEVRVWRHDPADPDGLPGNNVQALLVDAGNRLWVSVEGAGLSILDPARLHFDPLRRASEPALASDDVWALAEAADGIWFGTYDGGLYRRGADGRVRAFRSARDGLPSDTILALATEADGTLWVGTDRGLARRAGDRFEPVALPGADAAPIVYSLTVQPDGLWVGSSRGVWRRAGGRWRQPAWSTMFERPNALVALATDRRGERWIGSQRGLWRQQGDAPPVPVRTGGPAVPRAIGALALQPDGALWVPIAGLGLGYLRADWRRAARFAGPEDGLLGGMYPALAPAAAGGFWLAGYNGRIERLRPDGEVEQFDPDTVARLATVKPQALLEDRDGRLWVGHPLGLLRLGTDGAIDEWRADDPRDPAPRGQVHQLRLDRAGRLWLAAPGAGVQQRDPATGRVLLDLTAAGSGLGAADIEALELSPDDVPWVAGDAGVWVLDRAARRFRTVPSMRGGRVYALAFDGADALWLQRQSGLERHERRDGHWRQVARVGSAQGLPAVGATGLRVDAAHRVWLATPRGLLRWDPRRRLLVRFGGAGVDGQEYLDRAIAMDAAGILAAGSADGGVILLDTAAADPPAVRPALRLDRVSVRREGAWRDLPPVAANALRVPDREFRVGMRLLAYDDPAANAYWSRLDGFDAGWVALGSSGDRVFTGLAPGRYVLRTRARDAA
ncbi:MAG TPA: two-component regulator propeller domain-containing protein, partial [Thermomonas sp.]|nr:two-component regulator propeller domain-containing protein [Thermomonas sp.]